MNLLDTLRISVSTSRFRSDVSSFKAHITDIKKKYRSYSTCVARSAVLNLTAAGGIQLPRNAHYCIAMDFKRLGRCCPLCIRGVGNRVSGNRLSFYGHRSFTVK